MHRTTKHEAGSRTERNSEEQGAKSREQGAEQHTTYDIKQRESEREKEIDFGYGYESSL